MKLVPAKLSLPSAKLSIALLTLLLVTLLLLDISKSGLPDANVSDASNNPKTNTAFSNVGLSQSSPILDLQAQTPSHKSSPSTSVKKAMLLASRLALDPRRDDAAEEQIDGLASELGPKEFNELAQTVIRSTNRPEQRQAANFVLTRAVPRSLPFLAQIAASPLQDPHNSLERRLRMTALEAIDTAAADGADVTPMLEKISLQQSDQVLGFLTQVSLTGITQDKPGKLKRMIELALDGKGFE